MSLEELTWKSPVLQELPVVEYNLWEEPLVHRMGAVSLQVLCRTECSSLEKMAEEHPLRLPGADYEFWLLKRLVLSLPRRAWGPPQVHAWPLALLWTCLTSGLALDHITVWRAYQGSASNTIQSL